jgi:hypothetical protein
VGAQLDDLEREWLEMLLNPYREPDRDPFSEFLKLIAHTVGTRRAVGAPPVARMYVDLDAWRVICRSPIILSMRADPPDLEPSASYSIMGIPARVSGDLPLGVVVLIASDDSVARLTILTDLD